MKPRIFVFLDIEGTLIEEFDSPTFITTKERISDFIEGASKVICFSWAINNVEDLEKRMPIVKSIQDFYGFTFRDFVFRDDLFPIFKEMFGVGLDFNEFEDFCRSLGKEYVFQLFIRKLFVKHIDLSEDIECYLYDDKVEDTTLTTHINGSQITIKTVKV